MKSHALEAYGDPDTRRILRNGKIVATVMESGASTTSTKPVLREAPSLPLMGH